MQPFVLCRKFEGSNLAFRELEAPTGFALTEFFAFHDPAVARQEAGGFQGAAQAGFIELQGFRDAVFHSARLACQTAAFDCGNHVKFAFNTGHLHRLTQYQLQNRARKVSVLIFAVHSHFAGTWFDPDTGNRVFTFASGVAAAQVIANRFPRQLRFQPQQRCLRRPLPGLREM